MMATQSLLRALQYTRPAGIRPGGQFVRIRTRRGFVVLASDVSHFYENMASERPFTTALHIGEMLEGFDRLLALAPDESHIVPGHDPCGCRVFVRPPQCADELVYCFPCGDTKRKSRCRVTLPALFAGSEASAVACTAIR